PPPISTLSLHDALPIWLRPRLAAREGAWAWEFVFYASFGVVVTSSVALAGVLLVFSFLIIPACIGVLHAERLSRQLAIGWITGRSEEHTSELQSLTNLV